jgi:hypothetical protein
MIVVQNHYFAAAGQRNAVIDTRREANACRARLGLPEGRTLILARGSDTVPDVIWEIEFPDLAAWESDLEVLAASDEFTAIRTVQSSQLRHFERCAYEVDEVSVSSQATTPVSS